LKFDMQLGFPKAHHQIPLEEKVCVPLGQGSFPKIREFPFNISATTEASNFKFGTQLGFSKAHHKIIPRGKSRGGLGLGELPKILWFQFNIYTMAEARDFKFGTQLGFAKAHHKTTPREKWAWLGLGKLPYIWGSPLLFLQRPRCFLSVSGTSCFIYSVITFDFSCLILIKEVCNINNVKFDLADGTKGSLTCGQIPHKSD